MTPVSEAVSIPFVHQFISKEEGVVANDVMTVSAKAMSDELARMSDVLRPAGRCVTR